MGEGVKATTKIPDAKRESFPSQGKNNNLSQSITSPISQIFLLQRTAGNQAVQGLLKSGVIQAKLTIGEPGDIYEREADRVAEEVMRMPDPQGETPVPMKTSVPHIQRIRTECEEELEEQTGGVRIQRMCRECEEELHRQPIEEEEEPIQTKGISGGALEVTSSLESRISSIRGGGQPLSESIRAFFEPRFGADFSGVRVHTDSQAAESAQAVNALAYTVGQDIVFGAGQYAPETRVGKKLIAHELAHVMQQSGSDGILVGQSNEKRGLLLISQKGDIDYIQRYGPFVPCEQPSLSLESCPPREKGEVAQSKTDPMTLHGTTWLSEKGYSVNGYLVAGFAVGSSEIKKSLRDQLEWKQLVTLMKGSNIRWKIQGISDCSGSKDLNDRIRRARAEAVYNLLSEEARKHVVSREAVPLDECITGNQRRVDRTVNRSVLIEQVGRTVDIAPTEEQPIEAKLPKFVCGPDVTRQIADAVRLAKSIFSGWSPSQRKDACDALVGFAGASGKLTSRSAQVVGECSWDIYELHNNAWINQNYRPTCATKGAKPPCGESIQVDDDCHHAGAANYVIFGTMFRLCSDEDPLRFFHFTKSDMRSFIDLYKGSGPSGLGTPVPNFKGSLAWAIAGYDGWPSVSSPSGDWNHCVPMCPLPYSGSSFKICWHPHEPCYTCP